MRTFGELFKIYRLRAEFASLSEFASVLAERGYVYDLSIFSLWQKGRRIPSGRAVLITVLGLFIADNRKILQNTLRKTPLKMINPHSKLSVAWIKLPDTWKATLFCEWLAQKDIHVLPGSPFYWNNPEQGESFIRIALLRPKETFKQAMTRLQKVTKAYTM